MANRPNADSYSDLIELIDSAALDEGRWPEVLRGLAEHLGGHGCVMARQNPTKGHAEGFQVGLHPDSATEYQRYYFARNPLSKYGDLSEIYGCRAGTLRPWVRDILVRSEFYNDFMKRFDYLHMAYVCVDKDNDYQSVITVCRPERAERFETPDIDRLTRLMPHLMRSYAISRRLGGMGGANGTLGQYLEPLPHGVVMLDALGLVMHANRAARAIAATADGIAFTRNGIVAASAQANDLLQAAIRRAADPACRPRAARSVRLPRPSGAIPYTVAVCPLDEGATPLLFGRPSVLVEIRDLESANPATDSWLAECLDLTPAESRVAGLLLAGLDVSAIAARLRVSRNTVRTQLKQLMSKTGTHRQAELVRQIGLVAAMYRAYGQ